MSGSTPSTDLGPWRRAFGVATAPARLLSRYRADLRATVIADAVTFSSSIARPFFVLLAALAVAYPVAASVLHAVGAGRPRAESLTLALAPFFDAVYSESLPFMLAVAGIGAFSPSLGVLFMAVFIPADLIAASRSTVELQSLQVWGSFPAAILARLISYGLLWILAVEIPIAARLWSTAWAGRGDRMPSLASTAVARMCATAIFVFFWARALPWLIRPVFTWTPQPFTAEASVPTWVYWPILVIGATAIAGVAAIWPRPAQLVLSASSATPPAQARSVGGVLARQAVAVIVLIMLLAGLLPTVREALILVAGLLVAGPVMTLLLPHVRVPSAVARASGTARWVAAMVIALAVGWVIMRLAGDALYQNYFVLVLTLAVVAPLFRFLLGAGTRPPAVSPAPAPPGPTGAAGISTTLLLILGFWLALPSVAWAHDCPGELEECVRLASLAPLFMLAAALAAIGAGLDAANRALERMQRTEKHGDERGPWFANPSAADVPGSLKSRDPRWDGPR